MVANRRPGCIYTGELLTHSLGRSMTKRVDRTTTEQKRLPIWALAHYSRFARQHGGVLLSKGAASSIPRQHDRLQFRCKHGHVWTTVAHSVRAKGHWCQRCSANTKGKIWTLKDYARYAKKRGGTLLTNGSLGYAPRLKDRLHFRCKYGHDWKPVAGSPREGRWCDQCSQAGDRIWTLADYALYAQRKGGKLLTQGKRTSIPRTASRLRFRCSEGHEWEPQATSIKVNGQWCRQCSYNRGNTWSLDDYARYAATRGGVLLTKGDPKHAPLVTARLEFCCSKSHRWHTVAYRVKSGGSWCPVCMRHRGSWDAAKFQAYAAERGGELVSKHPVGPIQHLHLVRFTCAHGHQWNARAGQVMQCQTWCGKCGDEAKRKPLDDLHALAAERGGRLVRMGKNRGHKATFSCARGHEFAATPDGVKRGNWCPMCSASRSERIVRAHFEQLFGKPFPRVRPKWLRNTTGVPLELDGFCESLRLAFEHQGGQHYREVKHFGEGVHRAVKQRDSRKRALCRERGVVVIEIPELMRVLDVPDLRAFILRECDALGITVPKRRRDRPISLGGVYSTTRDDEALGRLQEIARRRGGQCLAREYVGNATPLPFVCSQGHRWFVRPQDVLAGSWCMKCARVAIGVKNRLGIEEMRRLASARGGECLSATYTHATSKLRWRCGKCGNKWEATPMSVRRGSWCPPCAYRAGWEKRRTSGRPMQRKPRLTIQDMQRVATARGGKCLSALYVNPFHKLRWECGVCGHAWEAAPSDVKNKGTWCPKCARQRSARAKRAPRVIKC
jgi:hypothetical protein